LAELGGWDQELLALELGELSGMELDFDLEITGFETADLDRLLAPPSTGTAAEEDAVPEPGPRAVSRLGDLWLLGSHRLLCADARQEAAYQRLLGGETAQLIFTDPPYNVPIQGHVSGLGGVQHREFAMASGEMSEAEFTEFLAVLFSRLVAASADGSIHFICMDWRHMGEVLAAGRLAYTELKNLCVWNKDNGGMGTFYRSKHELVFAFKNGTAPHINTFGLGDGGRYRTNVWDYAGANTFRRDRSEELAMHPTVKPVAMVIDAIKDCSRRGGVVLDPFGGSGTTLIAAERTSRRGHLIEIDPLYVDVIIRRWQVLTGREARHADTEQSFAQLSAERLAATDGVGHV
jgi:DNA modification methylase